MELNLTELTTEAEACEVYEIYKHCMFAARQEKIQQEGRTVSGRRFRQRSWLAAIKTESRAFL